MENSKKVDMILESIREEVSQFVSRESEISSSVDYEEQVLELSKKFARELITNSMGKMPRSRNSKKK